MSKRKNLSGERKQSKGKPSQLHECIYTVDGMHCPSCELAIEKKLMKENGVAFVDASVTKGEVLIQYRENKPSRSTLGKLFSKDGYSFHEKEDNERHSNSDDRGSSGDATPLFAIHHGKLLIHKAQFTQYAYSILAAAAIILVYAMLQKTGITSGLTVDENSTLGMFAVFGLIAGLSSCAALVGGLVLSMSKQWSEMYRENTGFGGRYTPHLLFNSGRLVSFALLGSVLGGLGSFIGISLQASAVLAMLVSFLMVALGLQMLNVPLFRNIRLGLPKFMSRWALNKEDIKSPLGPFVLGAVTFFLPCGFTITAQSAALISGSAVRGALITLFFALGTLPMLVFIGVTSSKLSARKHLSGIFLKSAGILVVFFAIYTFNAQLNLLGAPSLSDIGSVGPVSGSDSGNADGDLPAIDTEGKQVIEMSASASGYDPNYFVVRAGVPVKWVITNDGVSGCTNAVISKDLFSGEVPIDRDQVVKEFTPKTPGRYKFSCWMGMVTGTIDVVDDNGELSQEQIEASPVVEDGGGSCGCGGS